MSKIVVKRKVIVEEVIIPAEYADSLHMVLCCYERNILKVENTSLEQQKALTFVRQLIRKMQGEEV